VIVPFLLKLEERAWRIERKKRNKNMISSRDKSYDEKIKLISQNRVC